MPVLPPVSTGRVGERHAFEIGSRDRGLGNRLGVTEEGNMNFVPSEIDIMGVYTPPLLLAVIFGTIAMVLTVILLNRHRLSRYFMYPELVMLALICLYTSIIGTFVFPT